MRAADELRRVFAAFPSGVTAVTAEVGGRPVGLAASSFTSVSLDPPLVSVSIAHTSTTWPSLRTARRLGINVLGEHQDAACARLAGPAAHRFDDLAWRVMSDGAIVLGGVSAWFNCSVHQVVAAGDHDLILLRVHELAADHDVAPLVFHASRFRGLAG